jgi:hypothetical protein
MLLPSPLANPRELPGACANATDAADKTKPAIKTKLKTHGVLRSFRVMNELLSFLIKVWCGREDL